MSKQGSEGEPISTGQPGPIEDMFVVVPEYLGEQQNILDQPPYSWLREDTDILPPDIFVDDSSGFAGYMRAVALYKEAWEVKKLFTSPYQNGVQLRIYRGRTYLSDDNFHLAIDYLYKIWTTSTKDRYDVNGNPRKTGFKFPVPLSYVAWRLQQEQEAERRQLTGLDELLPVLSTSSSVLNAMPPKRRVNKYFRIFHSGAVVDVEPT